MKLFKSTILAMLGFAVALTSCSEDEYTPGAKVEGAHFAGNQSSVLAFSNEETSYALKVYRTAGSPSSYKVTATDESHLFTFPDSIHFAGGATVTDLVIGYDLNTVEEDKPYEISIILGDDVYVGRSAMNFSVTVSAPLVTELFEAGTGTYIYNCIWSGDDGPMPVYITYSPKYPTKNVVWTLGNMADDSVEEDDKFWWGAGNPGVDLQITCADLDAVDAYGDVTVRVPTQYTGYDHPTYGSIYVSDLAYFFEDNMGSPGSAAQYAEASYYTPSTGLFNLYLIYYGSDQEPGYYIGSNTYETFQMDGYPDNSIAVTYDGIFIDRNENYTAKSTIYCGYDVASVRATMVAGASDADIDGALKSILAGDEGVQEFKRADEIAADFPLSGNGTYTIVAVSYGKDGEAALYDYDTFNVELGANEDDQYWNDLGDAVYADGWVVAAFSMGDGALDPMDWAYSVPVQVYVGDEPTEGTVYRLVRPYGDEFPLLAYGVTNAYPAKRNIQFEILNTYVGILPQLCGFGTSKWGGEMTIGNLEGMYIQDRGYTLQEIGELIPQSNLAGYESSYEDNVVTVPLPLWALPVYDNEFGYNWEDAKPSNIILPEASENVRAKVKAARVARPTTGSLVAKTSVSNKAIKASESIKRLAGNKAGMKLVAKKSGKNLKSAKNAGKAKRMNTPSGQYPTLRGRR